MIITFDIEKVTTETYQLNEEDSQKIYEKAQELYERDGCIISPSTYVKGIIQDLLAKNEIKTTTLLYEEKDVEEIIGFGVIGEKGIKKWKL